MKGFLAVACLISVCYTQSTTKHPHMHTHEPNESESITFAYSGMTHDLIVKQRVGKTYNCYVADLTPEEEKHIHTDAGLRSAELRVLGQLSSATMEDMAMIDAHNVKLCGHAPHNGTVTYYVL
ncbi:hypothetical protein ACF0H5_015374 [Mactra antiquata]